MCYPAIAACGMRPEDSANTVGVMHPNNLILFTAPGHKSHVQLLPLGYLEWTNCIKTSGECLIRIPKQQKYLGIFVLPRESVSRKDLFSHVFLSPLWHLYPIPCYGLHLRALRSHSFETSHSVGLRWTSDRPDVEIST